MFDNHIARITKIEFDKADINGPVKFDTTTGSFVVQRKDFWAAFDHDWEKELTPGTNLRIWTVQGSRMAGIEVLRPIENQWYGLWFAGNNFDTKEESERKMKTYVDFIQKEGDKIAKLIDDGATFEMIHEALDDGHTGNTVGMAFGHALNTAADKGKADIIRQRFNDYFGVSESDAKGGIVNPAVVTIKEKTDDKKA